MYMSGFSVQRGLCIQNRMAFCESFKNYFNEKGEGGITAQAFGFLDEKLQ